MQVSAIFWAHSSDAKNLVLGNVSCYMWQLGGCVLKSLAVDSVSCFGALQLHEYTIPEQFCPVLPCLALHVSATRSHCLR